MAEHFEPDLLWPLIDEATILLDDGALLAVNKASGIACQGSAHTKYRDSQFIRLRVQLGKYIYNKTE